MASRDAGDSVSNKICCHTPRVLSQQTAADWYSLSDVIGAKVPHASWTIPEAEEREVATLGGARATAWFDMPTLQIGGDEARPSRPQDRNGLPAAVSSVHRIIDELVASGLPSSRIVVGGFGQGGGVALVAGLQCPHKLAGVATLSSWLPTSIPAPHKANHGVDALMLHGHDDDRVLPAAAEVSLPDPSANCE